MVRRTAEIAIIDPEDKLCINAKKDLKEGMEHRYMSNNSVYLTKRPSLKALQEIFESIKVCGEPGFINVEEAKRRRKDFAGVNPCTSGDTLIPVRNDDGTWNEVRIDSVVGKEVETWNGFEWTKVVPSITGYNQPMLEIGFSNGKSLKCTDYHKFLLDGCDKRVKAIDLNIGDVLEQFSEPDGYSEGGISVTSIKRIKSAHKVYCFTDPKRGTGMFNGIMTGQCAEILLPPNAVCNLTTVSLPQFINEDNIVNWGELAQAFKLSARAAYRMTCLELELPEWNEVHHRDRLLGCSMTGYQDFVGAVFNTKEEQESFLKATRNIIRLTADAYANELGTPKSLLVTACKPEGCCEETHVRTTDTGVYLIDELYDGIKDKQVGFYDINGYSFKGHNIGKVYKNDKKKCLKFTFKNGRILTITPKHPLSINGKWVEAKDIKEGEIIDHTLGTYSNKINVKLKDIVITNHRSDVRDYKLPTEMSEDLAYLIGAYSANGSFTTNNRIKFHCQYLEVHRKVQRLWKELFGVETNIIRSNDRDSYTQDFCSLKIRKWLSFNNLDKYMANDEKRIPLPIRQSSKSCILAFIVGYADNDGCFYNQSFCIDSADEKFLRHVQEVAESVGLSFGFSINKSRENTFSHQEMYKLSLSRAFSLQESIEYVNSHSVKAKIKGFVTTGKVYSCNPYKVIKVEETEPIDTYDIEVDDVHWYYQGALVSHNTLSLVSNAVSAGIHYQHSPYFIRRIRVNATDPLALTAKKLGWRMNPEVGQTMENANTLVIDFPCKAIGKTKKDVSAVEQLDTYIMFQKYYTEQNTSNTITVRPDEWDDVIAKVYNDWDNILAVTFLQEDGKAYPLMPYEECTKEEYESLKNSMKPFDPQILNNMEITTRNFGQEFEILDDRTECTTGVCPIR